jgi:hypothetical protein
MRIFSAADYGFVHVPTFSQTVPGSSITGLADSLQSLIRGVDARDPCGWIIDLRHNHGGNMWPTLAGVGPILGDDDKAGSFVNADSGSRRGSIEAVPRARLARMASGLSRRRSAARPTS